MNDDNTLISPNSDDTLPIILSKKTFADFILNFLGKKEKLSYRKKSNFLIRLNDIEQFYRLLNTKISKEQNIFIEHFSVTFEYNDDTSKTINGIEALECFNETRDVTPRSVSMFWNIVAKYPNAETLENQKIECSFIKNEEEGDIILDISHSNQAWGIEVFNLFKDKISQLIVEESKKYVFSEKMLRLLHPAKDGFNMIIIGAFFSIIIFAIIMPIKKLITGDITVSYENSYLQKDEYQNFLKAYRKTNDKESIYLAIFALKNIPTSDIKIYIENNEFLSKELNEVIKNIIDKKHDNELIAYRWITILLVSLIFLWWFLIFYFNKSLIYYGNKSFILITLRSEKEYIDYDKSKNKTEFYTLTAFLIAALSGVVGNIIYSFLV